jgi:hypothetical protein
MAVARITHVTASSRESWQDAVQQALARANKTLRNLTEIELVSQKATIEGGSIKEYWAEVKIKFILEE